MIIGLSAAAIFAVLWGPIITWIAFDNATEN